MKVPAAVGRAAIACVVGVLGTAALWWIVEVRDARAAASARPSAREAPPRVGPRVPATVQTVWLATRLSAVAPDTAPVVEIGADGRATVRRAPPPAGTPTGARSAAILLPARSLGQLGPDARAALVDLIGQWIAVRPVPPGAVRGADLVLPDRERAGLVSWVR